MEVVMNRAIVFLTAVLCAVAGSAGAQVPPLPEVQIPETTPTPAADGIGSSERALATAAGQTELAWTPRKGTQTWEEFIADWLTPRPVEKSIAVRVDEKYAYPHVAVSIKMEIVKEDEDTLWLRGIPPEDPESPLHSFWAQRQAESRIVRRRADWEREHGSYHYWLDFGAEIVPPPFIDSLEFEAHSTGLPTAGLWQMNFVRDDMDEDGIDDLVFPPARKGVGQPAIYRGSDNADFRLFRESGWLRSIPYDYGGVATGDFDGDGHRDIVLAIHFKQQYVLYGDGKGAFGRSERLQAPDPRMTSRACTVADFNGDGRDDIAFIAEIDLDMGSQQRVEDSTTVWVQLNTEKGWKLQTAGLPIRLISDDIESSDVDGDGRIDLVVGSNTADWRSLVFFNQADGWREELSYGVLSNTYHFDVEPHVRPDGAVEIYAAFMQFRMIEGQNHARTGLIRYEWTEDGLAAPDGAVYFDDDRTSPYVRVGIGDLNGDGITDLVSGRKLGGLEAWIGNGDGGFVLEKSPEFGELGRAFDIQLVDLNGDGRDDIIAAFAMVEEVPGGVRVWLTGGR
jgi:hypothetical protein